MLVRSSVKQKWGRAPQVHFGWRVVLLLVVFVFCGFVASAMVLAKQAGTSTEIVPSDDSVPSQPNTKLTAAVSEMTNATDLWQQRKTW